MPPPLPPSFFARDAVTVAKELIGTILIRRLADDRTLAGMIVETEAYREDDPASHSCRGPTERSRVMFGPAGRAYVYFIYGMHDCFNVVCGAPGAGEAALVRAIHPLRGLALMWRNRYGEVRGPFEEDAPPERSVRCLTAGPGRLCHALGVTRALHNGWDLTAVPAGGEALWIAAAGREAAGEPRRVVAGPRVGIRHAADRPWRFRLAGDPYVSGAGTSGQPGRRAPIASTTRSRSSVER